MKFKNLSGNTKYASFDKLRFRCMPSKPSRHGKSRAYEKNPREKSLKIQKLTEQDSKNTAAVRIYQSHTVAFFFFFIL